MPETRGADGEVIGPVPPGADPDAYDRLRRRVLWSMPTGLYVIGSRATVDGEDRANLMTASLVVQVATEPKLVGVAVDTEAVTAALIAASGRFTVNLVRRDDRAMVRKFVKPVTAVVRGPDGAVTEMAGHAVHEGAHGVPILDAAEAVLECEVRDRLDYTSHFLFVGEVVGVAGPDEGAEQPVLRMEDTRMSYGG
jgi:flavin reductase (DIM6/NTAB) family NADH-FMN oxidoreductase RutF